MAARIEPHVSVIYELIEVERLQRAAAAARPLRLRISRAMRWEVQVPGIYLDVLDPHGDLARFREDVLGNGAETYHPHVTLLHRDSVTRIEQVDEAWASLSECALDADFAAAELIVYEQIGDAWRDAARLRFAG